jgi:tRNA 5-methylaminomethyl-2-thiouridine biosynthesis bifunctional protein
VLEFGEDEAALARLDDIMTDPPLPAQLLATSAEGALLHVTGGTVFPDLVLDFLKDGAARHPCRAERIERREDKWFVLTGDGAIIASADSCFIAAGTGIAGLCELGIELGARAGQLSLASIRGALPTKPVSSGGYAMAFNGRLSFGATFERWSIANQTPPPVSKEGHVHNLNLVHLFAPDLAGQIDLETAHGRASIRVTTPDNMPIAGPVPHHEPGLYVLGALGSRGFTTSFLCAEHIVSHAYGEPSPMETSVASAISPDRFLNRKAKRKSVRATGLDSFILPSQQLD